MFDCSTKQYTQPGYVLQLGYFYLVIGVLCCRDTRGVLPKVCGAICDQVVAECCCGGWEDSCFQWVEVRVHLEGENA